MNIVGAHRTAWDSGSILAVDPSFPVPDHPGLLCWFCLSHRVVVCQVLAGSGTGTHDHLRELLSWANFYTLNTGGNGRAQGTIRDWVSGIGRPRVVGLCTSLVPTEECDQGASSLVCLNSNAA